MQDLWRLSAAEMASLIRSKKVSAKEAATAALARLDAVNPKINAVVDHRPEDVLAQASAVDATIGRGEELIEERFFYDPAAIKRTAPVPLAATGEKSANA